MRLTAHAWMVCSTAIVAGLVAGCGGGSEIPAFHSQLVGTTGKVTLDGEPLKSAVVAFFPDGEDGVRGATGVTGDDGKYELTTPIANMSPEDSKGAVPGKYKVVISKIALPDGSPVPLGTSDADAIEQGASESVPTKYSSMEQTELTAKVAAKGGEGLVIDFDLKTKE